MSEQPFELMEGEVRVWIDQDSIHIISGDLRYNDPTELTSEMARILSAELERLANILELDISG